MAISWAWLAGFTDGDGCIAVRDPRIILSLPPSIKRRGRLEYEYPRVGVRWGQKESEKFVLEEIFWFLSDRGIDSKGFQFSVSTRGHKYPQAELAVQNGVGARLVLKKMLPHLVVKSTQAKYALEVFAYIEAAKRRHGAQYMKGLKKEMSM